MKNINRDYLIKIDARTAEITAVPKNLKFFITDVKTSNIFFQLENLVNYDIWDPRNEKSEFPEDADGYVPKENSDNYTVTLRVVKPNNAHKTIEATPLNQPSFFMADLTEDYIDLVGIYECEVFIDTVINGYQERRTSEPFEYEVKKSVFYNLDEIIDTKVIALEDIATIDYVNKLVTGTTTLDGYATDAELNTKADKEHLHEDYVTQTVFDEAMARIGAVNINLDDFVANNSISLNRKPLSAIGKYSTAIGYNNIASGQSSHAEGINTKASSYASHAEGYGTIASMDSAHAEGVYAKAYGFASHAEGYGTVAQGNYQHVQGIYNIENRTDYVHIVGNGTEEAHSNAHTLDWSGNAWFAGSVKIGATNKELSTKDYVNTAIDLYNNTVVGLIDTKANKEHIHSEYATKEDLDKIEISGGSYDDSELRNLINNKADSKHTHDEYITQTELNEAVEGAAYNDTELRNLISDKADKEHTHKDVLVNISVSNNALTLTTDKYQILNNLTGYATVVLPTVTDYTEIHLFFTPTTDAELVLPNIKYQNVPNIEVGKTYEIVFTYVGIWLAGVIAYE